MWTLRRVGLLLLGVAVVVAAYLGYSLALGGFDGLPAIPQAYLKQSEGLVSPQYPVPLTIEQLQLAFGPNSPEGGIDLDYKNRLQIPGHDGVIACGSPIPDGTPLVTVAPISLALFGKSTPRPKPGTVPEISTFHADRAIIRFDRPVSKIDEMNTAKIVGIELASDPDDDPNTPVERKDKRKGRIWISQNRKSHDPADHIVVRTTGPVFVQLPEDGAPHDPNVPHVWTSALVEVFDRQNLPRKLRSRPATGSQLSAVRELTENVPPVAALARADDLRKYGAVSDILTGTALPPPTVVATGLKVFLKPSKKEPTAAKKQGERAASFSGVREVLLCEQVQMNLWADGTGGFPGGETTADRKPAVSPNADPSLAAAALTGGLLDAGTLVGRLDTRSLMLVETPGSFRYNFDTAVATFEVAPQAAPGQQNFVVVSRLSAKNQTDDCVCSKLILEMEKAGDEPTPNRPTEDTPAIRTITALGPQVYFSAQAEGLEASGAELKHVRDPKTKRTVTTLRGSPTAPVVAKRDGSKLTAGDPLVDAVVEIVGTETVVKGKPQKTSVVSVLGPGRLELVDKNADGGGGGIAQWGKWLKHEKQEQAGRTLDLLKFEENAAFVDPQSGFSMKSNTIWLWVGADPKAEKKGAEGKAAPIGALPERLVADGDVHVDSDEMVVRKTNKMTVWFRDVPPPKTAQVVAPPVVAKVEAPPKPMGVVPLPVVPLKPGEQPKVDAAQPKEAEKKPIPNPIQLQADTIESWVVRYPITPPKVAGQAPPKEANAPKLKYELERARCDDNVYVHQDPDPNDPDRPANGIDIQSNKLTLDHAPPSGSVLTVTGGRNKENYAAVSFDGTTIYGQTVVIDQPNNMVSVDGRGRLRVLSASDVAGNDLNTPSDLQVDWAAKMRFEGARAFAQFVGGVVVHQEVKPDPPGKPAAPRSPSETLPSPREAGPSNTTTNKSNLWCHQLDLTLDRPVYFNQLRKQDRNPTAKGDTAGRPKLKKVFALPADDPAAQPIERTVVFRELSEEKNGTIARGRMLTAKQMDFDNRSKEQELYAVGPGELRILQPESDDQPRQPADPNVRTSAKSPAQDKGEMKLTVVTFRDKMTGTDTGSGAFQKADFANGAVVMNTPTTNLMMALEAHTLPKRSVYLTCEDRMTVSSRKTKKDAPAEQWLDAVGNAEFKDDNRTGLGENIRYDGARAVLIGTEKRLATLQSNKRGVNAEQSLRAKKFVYNSKTGQVELSETSGGAFGTGR